MTITENIAQTINNNIENQLETMTKEKVEEIVNYVHSFYGPGQMYNDFFSRTVTLTRIAEALLRLAESGDKPLYNDSHTREMVRDTMLYEEGDVNTEYILSFMDDHIYRSVLDVKKFEDGETRTEWLQEWLMCYLDAEANGYPFSEEEKMQKERVAKKIKERRSEFTLGTLHYIVKS